MHKQKLHLFFFLILCLSISLSALALLLPTNYAALFLPLKNAQETSAAADKQPHVVVIDAGHACIMFSRTCAAKCTGAVCTVTQITQRIPSVQFG